MTKNTLFWCKSTHLQQSEMLDSRPVYRFFFGLFLLCHAVSQEIFGVSNDRWDERNEGGQSWCVWGHWGVQCLCWHHMLCVLCLACVCASVKVNSGCGGVSKGAMSSRKADRLKGGSSIQPRQDPTQHNVSVGWKKNKNRKWCQNVAQKKKRRRWQASLTLL